MPDTGSILIRVAGLDFDAWLTAEAGRSLEAAASSFSFSAPPRWPLEPNPIRIQAGSAAEIHVAGERVMRGFVDRWTSKGDGQAGELLTLTGRSKTQDAIDSTVEERTRFRNRTLPQIGAELLKPFGVELVISPELAGDELLARKFDRVKAKTGEPVFAFLERLARSRAVLLTDDGDGALVVSRVFSDKLERVATTLYLPHDTDDACNVLAWDVGFDAAALFTRYVCKGQAAATDADDGDTHKARAHVDDPFLEDRHRVLVVEPEGRSNAERCRARATWEANTRLGMANTLTYTVTGLTHSGGKLWRPRLLVPVHDEVNQVFGDFLIVESRWQRGPGGTSTRLTLRPPEAYELTPPAERSKRKGGKRKGGFAAIRDGVTVYRNAAGEAVATGVPQGTSTEGGTL